MTPVPATGRPASPPGSRVGEGQASEGGLILGTAGHIDHGKTALVRALTGVDTDRLAEEKRRGITIELGFARYAPGGGVSFGIVDVPGHESFVRTMVAGATGMDIVLLVVAADEGVMPQTREHLAIVELLGVDEVVVALTKADLVEAGWMELVVEEVEELLAATPYEGARIVPTSIRGGAGVEELREALVRAAGRARRQPSDDLARLPVDRVFRIEGAGTVATGTLWSGRIESGSTLRILPRDEEARVRALEVHGAGVEAAAAGQRAALALTGAAVRRGLLRRGDVLVADRSWSKSMMLTVRLRMHPESGSLLEHGQRLRVHLGTVEVMGRVALLDADQVAPGEAAPAQLRLEAPVVARSGDRLVLRSYSPPRTIAGASVLEPAPPKRKRLSSGAKDALRDLSRGGVRAVAGAVRLAGWEGLRQSLLAVRAGWVGAPADAVALVGADFGARLLDGALFDRRIASRGEDLILAATGEHHRLRPLDAGAPLLALRAALPPHAHRSLADCLAAGLAKEGRLVVEGTTARLPNFEAALSPAQEKLARRLLGELAAVALEGLSTVELEDRLSATGAADVLSFLAERGRVRLLADAFWIDAEVLERATRQVAEELGGREGLGPADFRGVLPLSRRRLIPILEHLDALGVTERTDTGRSVAGR